MTGSSSLEITAEHLYFCAGHASAVTGTAFDDCLFVPSTRPRKYRGGMRVTAYLLSISLGATAFKAGELLGVSKNTVRRMVTEIEELRDEFPHLDRDIAVADRAIRANFAAAML